MARFTPDFEAYFGTERFSDLEIEILEDDAAVGGKRKRGLTIPGHSMVLVVFSNYCKIKLENWGPGNEENSARDSPDTAGSHAKPTIQLLVPAGQTEIATRLVRCMYQKDTAVTDLEQPQLLQLLMLADRFEVPKVQAAVLDVLKELSATALDWDTALALLDLPFSCDDQPTHKQVVTTAEEKVMQQLGDLEEVWADEQLQSRLLSLPHAALLRLLQHDDTRVASESTVVYTILQWWEKQQQSYRDSHVQQLKELMQQVRMQHLSLLYINTYMMNNDAVLSCYNLRELAIAGICTDSRSKQALQDQKRPLLEQNPAWTAAKRPASNRQQLVEWKLPLSQLRAAVTETLSSKKARVIWSPVTLLQGHTIQIQAKIHLKVDSSSAAGDSSSGMDLQVGFFLFLPRLVDGAVCNVTCKFVAKAAAPALPSRDECGGPFTHGFHGGVAVNRGYSRFFSFPSISSWSDIEAKLKQKQMVHADDCLHITAEIIALA